MSHATVARGVVRGERSKRFCFGVPQKSRKRTSLCRAPRCCDFRFGCVRSVRSVSATQLCACNQHTSQLVLSFLSFFNLFYLSRAKLFVKQNFIRFYFFSQVKLRRQNRKSNVSVSSSRPARRARTTDESINVLIACAPAFLRFILRELALVQFNIAFGATTLCQRRFN